MRIIITKIIVLEFLDLTNLITLSEHRCTRTEGRNNNLNFSTRTSQTSTKNTINRININSCSGITFTRRGNRNCLNLSRDCITFRVSTISNSNFYQSTFTITCDRNTTILTDCIFSSRFINLNSLNLSCRLNIRNNR